MTLLEEFNYRWPEFKNPPVAEPPIPPVTDEQIQYWLDWADNFLCPGAWGLNFRDAVLAMAAVMLSMWQNMQQDGSSRMTVMGPIASASVGGESVSYGRRGSATLSLADEWLEMYPPYGPYLVALKKMSLSGVKATWTGFNWWEHGKTC